MHVLVVDDNSDAADTLAALIEMELGCVVSVAYDGGSALQRALQAPPDVLILDIRMPGFGGVEVAREFSRMQGEAIQGSGTLLLLAVTGTDVSGSLADIDSHFHGAFAKPVDGEALVALLRRHWRGESEARTQTPSELSDLLCQVVRKSVPLMKARGLVLAFDYLGPALVLRNDDAALHSGVYRLLCAMADLVNGGDIELRASVQPETSGAWALSVEVASFATLAAPSVVSEVLARLGLADVADDAPAEPATRSARSTCPCTGARVHFDAAAAEGLVFRYELLCQPLQVLEPDADALGARAWIIDARESPSATLGRRLQRLGWSVQRWASYARAREAALSPSQVMPDLLIVMDAGHQGLAAMAQLQAVWANPVRCVHLVPIGSTALRGSDNAGCAVHVDPLSPGELIALTRTRVRPELKDGQAAGVPQPRPRLLVVDDMEVNRVVASGLAQALGYDVAVVADGLDAIRHCSESAPDVVLMDINMAVVGGIDATQRIRLLQRIGRIPPFPIVAATANDDQGTADRCRLVGMDGFLTKPLALQALREELRRVTVNAPH
jgi:CheY-like chemotaxis protein